MVGQVYDPIFLLKTNCFHPVKYVGDMITFVSKSTHLVKYLFNISLQICSPGSCVDEAITRITDERKRQLSITEADKAGLYSRINSGLNV